MDVTSVQTPKLPASQSPVDKVIDRLVIDDQLRSMAQHGKVDALVVFNAPADARDGFDLLADAESMQFGPERKTLVASTLDQIADTSQAEATSVVRQLEADGAIAGHEQFWITNTMGVKGADLATLEQLAKQPNVARIVPNSSAARVELPNEIFNPATGEQVSDPNTKSITGDDTTWIGWGVKKMNAKAAWQQGITGQGITVASLDTGVITDHPGLAANYRGQQADGTQDHNYNWSNFVEGTVATSYPIDDVGHGTHTIGNSVGYHPKNLIGVAPDAQFIASRALGNAGGNLFAMQGAMQWMLAPTDLEGNNPRPDLAPDIVNNSWGADVSTANAFLWQALKQWKRAGIFPVFAAGNSGHRRGAGSVGAPGLHKETLTVGATEKDDSRSFFSSYGPSYYSKDVKPEVMAPGRKIFSAWTDGTFRDTFVVDGEPYEASGTSMATPHVAGAVALYMQAHPNATFDEIREAVTQTATHPDEPNQETGYGRVQVGQFVDTIDPDAKLTPKERVDELVAAYDRAEVFESKELESERKNPPQG